MDAREIKTKPNKQPQKCTETGTREKVVMRVVMRSLGIHKKLQGKLHTFKGMEFVESSINGTNLCFNFNSIGDIL